LGKGEFKKSVWKKKKDRIGLGWETRQAKEVRKRRLVEKRKKDLFSKKVAWLGAGSTKINLFHRESSREGDPQGKEKGDDRDVRGWSKKSYRYIGPNQQKTESGSRK